MSTGALSSLGSYVGWMFLPGMATTFLQSFLYRLFIRAGDPIPVEGTSRHVRDKRRIFISVIVCYLLFTIYEAWHGITTTPNFYELLGVDVDVDDKTLRKKFKMMSVKFHPDKMGPGYEHVFMGIKTMYDILADPVKRFAYERLGPEIVTGQGYKLCSTQSDYLLKAVTAGAPGYIGMVVFLMILGAMGRMEFGKYWRFFCLFGMLSFEYAVITRPYFLAVSHVIKFITRRTLLPFEQLILARQMMLTSFVAISQLGPLFSPPTPPDADTKYAMQLNRLQALAAAVENTVSKWTAMEVAPFVNEHGEVSGEVKVKLKDFLVQENIRSQPVLRDALGRVRKRRKENRPSRR